MLEALLRHRFAEAPDRVPEQLTAAQLWALGPAAAALAGGYRRALWACGAIALAAVPVTYLLVPRRASASADGLNPVFEAREGRGPVPGSAHHSVIADGNPDDVAAALALWTADARRAWPRSSASDTTSSASSARWAAAYQHVEGHRER